MTSPAAPSRSPMLPGPSVRRASAVVIACFDDPGLDEARAAAGIQVPGIGPAGFQAAMLLGQRLSVAATPSVAIPAIEGNLNRSGLASA